MLKVFICISKVFIEIDYNIYQKSAINITDLINKNDDFDYNNNLLAHEKGCRETCQKTLWINENPVAPRGFTLWTPTGALPLDPRREGRKLTAIFGFYLLCKNLARTLHQL